MVHRLLSRPLLHVAILALGLVPCACGSSSGGATSEPAAVDGGVDARADAPSTTPYVPKGVTIGNSNVTEVRFTDEQNGFLLLYGNTPETRGIWATADAGASWTKRAIDIASTGLAFTSDLSRVWAAGTGSVSNLWSSGDRGASFAPLSWSDGSTGRIEFVDASTVLLSSFLGNDLHRSTDGGATWTKQAFDGLYAAVRIAVIGRDVWLAGGLSFKADGARVSHSTDAGATFAIATLTDKAHSFEGGALRALAVVSPSEVWVAGASRQVFHTTNAGADWKQITGIPDSLESFGGVHVRGSQVTLAGSSVSGYALYVSDDGGTSFRVAHEIRCPSFCGAVSGIASPSPGVFFVYGDRLLWRVEQRAP